MPPNLLILSGACPVPGRSFPFCGIFVFSRNVRQAFPVIPSSGDNLAEIVWWRYYLSEICSEEVTKMPNIVEVIRKIFAVRCTKFVCHFRQIRICIVRMIKDNAPLLFRVQEDAINEAFVVFLVFFFIQMTDMSHIIIVVAKI